MKVAIGQATADIKTAATAPHADRISKVGHYPAHLRPGGVAGIGCGRPMA